MTEVIFTVKALKNGRFWHTCITSRNGIITEKCQKTEEGFVWKINFRINPSFLSEKGSKSIDRIWCVGYNGN